MPAYHIEMNTAQISGGLPNFAMANLYHTHLFEVFSKKVKFSVFDMHKVRVIMRAFQNGNVRKL